MKDLTNKVSDNRRGITVRDGLFEGTLFVWGPGHNLPHNVDTSKHGARKDFEELAKQITSKEHP